jgi:CubicO group peptidase (beta-lactamase class C family)
VSLSEADALGPARAVVDQAVRDGAFPGGVLAVGTANSEPSISAHGRLTFDPGAPSVGPGTIYDLASLTKVVATTAAAMLLHGDGELDLALPAERLVPELRGPGKERITLAQLLTHASGIEAWAPLYQEISGKDAYLARIGAMPLACPPGERSVYGDFGFVVLGSALERLAGESLETLVGHRLFEPLGIEDTVYRPGPALRPRIAPTEVCPWRARLLHGEVHDENAFAMGGVAPQAGLFGTAADLSRLARLLLSRGRWHDRALLRPATVELFTRRAGVPDSTRALGWDTPSDTGYSTAGSLISRRAYGHVGFTGTSLWIDPEQQMFVILLTNRVHPTRTNQAIRAVRPAVADAVVLALSAAC